MKKPNIFVAMSGGVDSAVSALLLLKQGFKVTGIFMKNWTQEIDGQPCPWTDDQTQARRVAAYLGIPIYTFDFEEDYRKRVVEYFFAEYAAGRTPNPDVMCNKEIKFGLFLEKAKKLGADFIATGHYAQIQKDNGHYYLLAGRDPNKDQSYFLYLMTQEQLAQTIFPIGHLEKSEVRKIAEKFGLPNARRKDSQGICFIGPLNVREFLKTRLSRKPGPMVDGFGQIIGQHEGVWFYTIGQRHGLGIGGGRPYYVLAKDLESNTLVVSDSQESMLLTKRIKIENLHWIAERPKFPLRCQARIRYQQPLEGCTILPFNHVIFDRPQRAATPGQAIVFYQGENVFGGAIISE